MADRPDTTEGVALTGDLGSYHLLEAMVMTITERIPKCEKHGTRAMREIPQRLLGLRLWLCESCSSEAVKTWTGVNSMSSLKELK